MTKHLGPRRLAPLLLLGGACLLAALASSAQDPPHWASSSMDINCTTQCHTLHNALDSLNSQTNVNLCQSCHNTNDTALAKDLPISNSDKAVRGVSGTSHAFDVLAVQDFDGDGTDDVLAPDPAVHFQMSLRIMQGKVVCSTCHNQHQALAARGGTPRVGNAKKITNQGGTGSVISGGIFSGAEGLWYLVEIVTSGSDTQARFCYSKDNGISWFPSGCNPPGTTTPNLTADGAVPVALDNGVTVAFATGSYQAGEQWELAASWPFMREPLNVAGAGSQICRDCHRPWVMTAVDTWDGSPKSHPTGVPLPVGNPDFRATPLDGNGQLQNNTGDGADVDGNPTNDLTFDGNGHVQCLTCHAVHFVDSNTQTADGAP